VYEYSTHGQSTTGELNGTQGLNLQNFLLIGGVMFETYAPKESIRATQFQVATRGLVFSDKILGLRIVQGQI